jgi:hypothetical protein
MTTMNNTCPKCGSHFVQTVSVRSRIPTRWVFGCGTQEGIEHEIAQSDCCRARQLEAVILKIDRMSSAWLSHGRDEVKSFAREVFDVCEQIINPAPVGKPAESINSTDKNQPVQ